MRKQASSVMLDLDLFYNLDYSCIYKEGKNTPTKLNYSRDGAIFIRWNGMSCYKRA